MKKEDQEQKPEINKFLKEWNTQDYNSNSRELFEIGVEYKKCIDIANKDLSWQEVDEKGKRKYPRKYATEYFQIRNGGMTPDLRVTPFQQFEINIAKLDKYFKWVEFNKSDEQKQEDRKVHDERFKDIKEMLAKLTNK